MKAVIFDFDGLILDTETAWFEAYKSVLQQEYQFELLLNDFVKCVGADDNVLFNLLEEKLGRDLNRSQIKNKASKIHTEIIEKEQAREGVKDYLEAAKALGLKVALCTSSHYTWVEKHLINLNLYSYFDYFITQDDVEKIKPNPELFLKALEVLGIEPGEAVVFEDSMNGLISAQEANIPVVLIPNTVTNHLHFEGYFLKLNSMRDKSLKDIVNMIEHNRQK